MKKTLLSAVILSALLPLTGMAKDLTVAGGYLNGSNDYISNDHYLIHLDVSDHNVRGSAWSKTDGWSESENLFTIPYSTYSGSAYELSNGTIVLLSDDNLVSYSATYGFQYFQFSTSYINDVIVNDTTLTLVDCGTGTGVATSWTEASGFGTATVLTGSVCNDDLSYMTGKKQAIVDYYSGKVYNASTFAVIASKDLSSLGYVGADDDYDSQGHNPRPMVQKNGDTVFAFDNHLYGYAYDEQTWQPIVTLKSGYALVGLDYSGEYNFPMIQTPNKENTFAFAANAAKTKYDVYRWTSATGWELEKTYTFTTEASLILPATDPAYFSVTSTDKSPKNFEWAFWVNASDTLTAYRWSNTDGYVTTTTRDLACNTECVFKLSISKKGKLFLTWTDLPAVYASVWSSDDNQWDDTALASNDDTGSLSQDQVTSKGQWIIKYAKNNARYFVRWTPDQGWQTPVQHSAEGIYFDDFKLYEVDLGTNHKLTVNQYQWKTRTRSTLNSTSEVSSFDNNRSFIYRKNLFLDYLTQDHERVVDQTQL